ncbi:MAG: MmgE/PrpD family protein [Kibdelosporangium sp.]
MTAVTAALAAFAVAATPPTGFVPREHPVSRWIAQDGEAFAVGLEVGVRVHDVIADAVEGGWDPVVAGVLAATTTATGRTRGSDAETVTIALGIALTQAGGFAALGDTPLGDFSRRRAAENGRRAVLLAEAGVTAPRTGLEGRRGLAALLAPSVDPAAAIEDLGRIWRSARQEVVR